MERTTQYVKDSRRRKTNKTTKGREVIGRGGKNKALIMDISNSILIKGTDIKNQ